MVRCEGVIDGLSFLYRQHRIANPMLDLRLFRQPLFGSSLGISILAVFSASGASLFVAQYLRLVLGMGPLQAGLWLAPAGAVHILAALVTPGLLYRFGARNVLVGGFIVTAAGCGVLSQIPVAGPPWMAIAGVGLLIAGLVPMLTTTTDAQYLRVARPKSKALA
jgi:MFS transporter, DHA2 family, multidrug resistance protein